MFEISPCMFDWVEVWRIGWKFDELSTSTFNELFKIVTFMPRSIIHDNYHSWFEMLEKVRLKPFHKHFFVDGMVISIGGKKFING